MGDETYMRQPGTFDVNEQDVAVLARIAGIPIVEDRLAMIARDLTATLRLADELDAVLQDTALPVIRPFDASWPGEKGASR